MSWEDRYARHEMWPVEKVRVDYSYQPEEEKRGAIVSRPEDYSRGKAGAFPGSLRDDGYVYLFDASRRFRGARLAGETEVPVMVYEGMTPEEEGIAFVALNKDRKPITPQQIHKAALFSGLPTARTVQRVLDSLGITDFAAWGTAYSIVERKGERVFVETMSLLYNAWRKAPGSFEAPFLRAVSNILYRWDREVDRGRLITRLQERQTPPGWIGIARSMTGTSGGVAAKLELAIRNEYNKRLTTSALLTARERAFMRRSIVDAA